MAENEVIQDEPILEQDAEEVVEETVTDEAEELEEKAFGPGNDVPDPVAKGSNSRSADKDQGEKATPRMTKSQMLSGAVAAMSAMSAKELMNVYSSVVSKAPARSADKAGAGEPMQKIKMAEDVQEMFAGEELSEEFIDKATIIFEAAINARLQVEQTRLEEEFESRLAESIEQTKEDLTEKLDGYLDHVVTEWTEDNKIAIETSMKTEITESFIQGLKGLFETHYIDIPEEKLDILGEMSSKVEELESKLNEQIESNIELKGQLDVASKREVFEEAASGLAKTQVEKFKALAESVDYDSDESYAEKLAVIRENYFAAGTKQAVLEEEVIVAEDTDDGEAVVNVDPNMKQYMSAISRTLKK